MRESYQHSRFVTARVMNGPDHVQQCSSALPPTADIAQGTANVGEGPYPEVRAVGDDAVHSVRFVHLADVYLVPVSG